MVMPVMPVMVVMVIMVMIDLFADKCYILISQTIKEYKNGK